MPDWIKASCAVRLNTMAALACAIVVGALLFWNAWTFAYIFWIGTSPLPFGDQWSLFPDQIIRNLFGLHNEHRPTLGRLVGLLDWYVDDARNRVNATFIVICYPVLGLTLFKLVKTIVADWRRAVLFTGLASAIILSAAQWENMLWGFQTTFVGSFVLALLALFFAALAAPASQLPGRKTANVVLCLSASFFAVFSLASGLLVLPFVTALFFLLGTSPRIKYGYSVFAIAALGFYFYGYAGPSDQANPLTSLRDMSAVGRFTLAYVGSPFARGDPDVAAITGAAGLLVLIVLIANAAITLLREPRLLQAPKGAAYIVLLLFAVFIFCTGGLTALGRSTGFGIGGALSPRYATPALFFWGDIVVACLVQSDVRRDGVSPFLCCGGAALGVALASYVAFNQRAYVESMYNKRAEKFNAAIAYLLGIRNQPVVLQLYPQAAAVLAGHLDKPFQRLQRAHKSIFTDDWVARLGTPLREWKPDLGSACRGAIDRRALVPDQATAISELVGWAWDDERRRVPDLIAFTDARGLVVGFAAPGFRRVDVRQEAGVTSSAAGWNGFARADQTVTIHAYGVALGFSNRACEFAASLSSR